GRVRNTWYSRRRRHRSATRHCAPPAAQSPARTTERARPSTRSRTEADRSAVIGCLAPSPLCGGGLGWGGRTRQEPSHPHPPPWGGREKKRIHDNWGSVGAVAS